MEQEARDKEANQFLQEVYKESSVTMTPESERSGKADGKDELTQKNEEIKILWNVIAQMNNQNP